MHLTYTNLCHKPLMPNHLAKLDCRYLTSGKNLCRYDMFFCQP